LQIARQGDVDTVTDGLEMELPDERGFHATSDTNQINALGILMAW